MHKFALTSVTALVAACGGSRPPQPAPLPEPTPATDDQARVEAPPPDLFEEESPAPDVKPVSPIPEETEVITASAEPTEVPITASAELAAVGSAEPMGMITFSRASDGMVTITGQFSGLKKKASHALMIHEYGDCSQKGTRVGKHLNPTNAKHGPPSSSERHAGDFGNVMADAVGNATFLITTDSITLEPGRADSVVGRAVVLHKKPDDKKGKDSPALACGVIELD